MNIIPVTEKEKWNTIVTSFKNWDIYYLHEYADSLRIHGDGKPYLLYFEFLAGRLAYVVFQNDISDLKYYKGSLEKGKYFDWTSPYGYGGPMVEGILSDDDIESIKTELFGFAKANNIISQFIRFHPLLHNSCYFEKLCSVANLKQTVVVDTESTEIIWKNMTPNNRNMVRKAEKNGVKIIIDHGERINEFMEIYKQTMDMRLADEYYYFEKEYFQYLINNFKDNIIFFYAEYQGKIISASIFLYNNTYMHYHLSGTLPEFRNLASVNLILTKAAEWAAQKKINQFHLGGGIEAEDSLFKFKKNFNRNGLVDFYIGSTIFLKDKFDYLVELRRQTDSSYDDQKKFMIKYRA